MQKLNRLEPVVFIIFLILVFMIALRGLTVIEYQSRLAAGKSLQTVLNSIQQGVTQWSNHQINETQILARKPEVIQYVKLLLQHPAASKDHLIGADAQIKLRELLTQELKNNNYLGFFIIDPTYISIGSMRDSNIGSQNLIAIHHPDLLKKVFNGESLIIPTIQSDVSIKDGVNNRIEPTMFIATPIIDQNNRVIAVFTVRIDPTEDFTDMMQLGRIGKSGETYSFDQSGTMLNESRFTEDLRKMGMIGPTESSILNIRLTDPGANLTLGEPAKYLSADRPYTLMAQQALNKKNGLHINGYHDYRGVTVLGAWVWDSNLNVGFVTEIDQNEALAPYELTRQVLLGALGVTVILSILMTIYLTRLRNKATNQLQKSKETLEVTVKERTANLVQINKDLLEQVEERIRAEEQLRIAHERLAISSARLEYLATIDGLTDISNRRSFDMKLKSEWQRCLRSSKPISLIIFDIDYFKLYNDSLGHQAGDECLQAVGRILKSGTYARRPSDLIARYGGEEFVVILSETNIINAEQVAKKIQLDIHNMAILHPKTLVANTKLVTISMGVASIIPESDRTPDSLIKIADKALYQAKNAGRNQVITL